MRTAFVHPTTVKRTKEWLDHNRWRWSFTVEGRNWGSSLCRWKWTHSRFNFRKYYTPSSITV